MSEAKLVERLKPGLENEQENLRLQPPPKYKVMLLNDDYTPMEFVVEVLQTLFFLDEATAAKIMLQVHTQGKGICGLYTKEIAETKVKQVIDYARGQGHPLMCTMELE